MKINKKRNLLYLNSMPFEMVVEQGRLWEIRCRDIKGYSSQCCTIFYGSKKNEIKKIKDNNVAYCIKAPIIKTHFFLIKIAYLTYHFFFLLLSIYKICISNKIDIIISNSNSLRELEVAAIIISKIYNIPVIGYIGRNPTGFQWDRYNSIKEVQIPSFNLVVRLERLVLNKVDKVILRPGTQEVFTKLFRIDISKVVLIPHKTKFDQFKAFSIIPKDIKKWIKGKKVIMTYCRLSPEKCVDDMIKALNIVKDNNENVGLLLIGDGREKDHIVSLVKEYRLEDYVMFKGTMSQKKIASIAYSCHILIHFYGGKAMFESALTGKPLITYDSDMGHYFGLITHMSTAIVSKNRDIKDLAHSIGLYLNDDNLCKKLGLALQQKAIDFNNWEKTDKKLKTAIESVIINKGK